MIVRLKEDDSRFKLKKGDLLEVIRYWLDPGKYTVLRRISDNYDPECNVYSSQVERLTRPSEWPCKYCGAKGNKPCVTKTGKAVTGKYHRGRYHGELK